MPVNDTDAEPPEGLEEIVKLPEREIAAVGVNVTETVQDAFGANVPQPDAEKSTDGETLTLVDAVPELVMVTVCALDELPTLTEPNDSDVGDAEITGTNATPVPVNDTDAEPPEGLEEIVKLPERETAAVGVNVTETVQDAFGASVPQPDAEKSTDGETLTLVDAVPELVIVTVCALDELPTLTEPKVSEVGDTVIIGAVAGAETDPLKLADTEPLFELVMFKVAQRGPGLSERVNVTVTRQESFGFWRLLQPDAENEAAAEHD